MSQPAKVLLLYAHPESQDSVANRVLLKPATQLSNVTVHDLYAHYPDFFIDIPREQALLREHEVIGLTRAQADAQELKNARDSAEVVETAFCTFVLSRIAGEIASILDGIPLSVQRRFPELENRHVDFLKRDIIKAMNKAAALDELIPGLLSEYIEQSG